MIYSHPNSTTIAKALDVPVRKILEMLRKTIHSRKSPGLFKGGSIRSKTFHPRRRRPFPI